MLIIGCGNCQNQGIKPFKTLKGHPYKIMYLDFSSDGKYLASCGWDNTIRIWDMNNFSQINVLEGHTDVVWTSVLSNNKKYVASCSLDGSFILWDFKSGDKIKKVMIPGKVKQYLPYADSAISEISNSAYGLAISNDNKLLAVGCADGKIRMYETDSLSLKHTLSGHKNMIISIVFSKKSDLMVSSAIGKEIIVWDTKTFNPVHIIEDKNAYFLSSVLLDY